MKKVLFLIHDLGQGGAEKVLVNLVNNMDTTKFDITVMTLFDVGVNKQFLSEKIHYKTVFKKMFRGNSHLMKLFTPKQLHKLFIKDKYDIEIAYLEGPCARIISGCPNKETKLISWIHCTMKNEKEIFGSYRSKTEMLKCYQNIHNTIFVSNEVKDAFFKFANIQNINLVLYNTLESDVILYKSKEVLNEVKFKNDSIKWCGVGKITENKGFDRLIEIQKKLSDLNYDLHLYILGDGPKKNELEKLCQNLNIKENVTFLGYQTNPYKYVANCDLFVCSSYSEGFSTAATEALIVGTPVCTVEVSGMKEMLGKNNEYGVVVDNDDEALYNAIKELLDNPQLLAHYKEKANERGKYFSKEKTVKAVEEMLLNL